MTKMELKKAKAMLTKIEATKGKIAVLRDVLRTQVLDLEDIIENLDTGVEYFDEGLRSLIDGLDKVSELL
jgi:hypothetical protein